MESILFFVCNYRAEQAKQEEEKRKRLLQVEQVMFL
jgi:hypothetical protein